MQIIYSLLLFYFLTFAAAEGEELACLQHCICDEQQKTVICQGQAVTEFPPSVPSGFDVLIVRNATIRRLEKLAFRKMDRLREVHIENCNQFEAIEKFAFKSMRKLRLISIANCQKLTVLTKGAFSGIGNENNLKIRITCPISAVHPGILRHAQNIRELTITGNNMTLQKHAFSCITQLDFLTLSGVTRIEPNIFANSTRFYIVHFKESRFDIPKNAFSDLAHVHQLLIQRSTLPVVNTDAFSGLSTIETIELFDSDIGYLSPHAFSGVINFGRLRISRNTIGRFDSPESVLSSALQLRFEENIINCSCEIKWMSAYPDRRIAEMNYCGSSGVHRTVWNFLKLSCSPGGNISRGIQSPNYTFNYKVNAVVTSSAPRRIFTKRNLLVITFLIFLAR